MSARHQHKFQRLSDVAVFCSPCGAIKVAEAEAVCTRPHYATPYWWWQSPTIPTYYPWTVTTGTVTTGDVASGTTFAMADTENVTYTRTNGGVA